MDMVDTSQPGLSEHTAYLSDSSLLALLEMGLEATLAKFQQTDQMSESPPLTFLASWLMRHNPRHSANGAELVERFMKATQEREALADVTNLEEAHQRDAAALQMQSAMRGHAARMLKGEQLQAATTLQSGYRGRAARQQLKEEYMAATVLQSGYRGRSSRRELAEEQSAAIKMQSMQRGRNARKQYQPVSNEDAEAEAVWAEATDEQQAAAAKVQASVRGQQVRQEQARQAEAAVKVQATYRGNTERQEQARQAEAAVKVQATYRGNTDRARSAPLSKLPKVEE